MRTHKYLDVYKLSVDFVKDIYLLTKDFPKEEQYSIISQIRRSAVSIPSNIAEGSVRNHKKENIQFLYVSLSSAAELDTLFQISLELGYIDQNSPSLNAENLNRISRMLQGLIKSIA